MAKKKESGADIMESPEAIVDQLSKAEVFFNTNKRIVTIVGVSIALVVGGVFGYYYFLSEQNHDAQVALFPAINFFEEDSLQKALTGNGIHTGLEELADEYAMTQSGKLAALYTGVAKLKSGKYDEAIDYLSKFSSSDFLIQARANCLIGDAYMEKNETENAIEYYEKAANTHPTEEFTPGFLIKLGYACEKANDIEGANEAYNRIIEDFPNSIEANDAKKLKARTEFLK